MKTLDARRGVALFCACFFVGCSHSNIGLPATTNPEAAVPMARYASLYSFGGEPDGHKPYSGLVAADGTLYGTTSQGGTKCGAPGCGTVFSVTPAGNETVLHRFGGEPDGVNPSGLTTVNHVLYGTTYSGGARCKAGRKDTGCGTVFSITESGKEQVLYRFKGLPDGANPSGDLVSFHGALYGVTWAGGLDACSWTRGCGTVFRITTSGKERVIYRFTGGSNGASPSGRLAVIRGVLYGVAYYGTGGGVVFALTPQGKEKTVYQFNDITIDPPPTGLIAMNNVLYGAAPNGGRTNDGAILRITTAGNATLLYSFKGARDGSYPYALPIAVNGTLYGTAASGADRYKCTYGCGTIFSVTTSGKLHVLYTFKGAPDGVEPLGALLNFRGAFYGTTSSGGNAGYGTVFRLTN